MTTCWRHYQIGGLGSECGTVGGRHDTPTEGMLTVSPLNGVLAAMYLDLTLLHWDGGGLLVNDVIEARCYSFR